MSKKANLYKARTRGLECTRCGCTDLRVLYTRHRLGCIHRVRVCRHCGKRIVTKEK